MLELLNFEVTREKIDVYFMMLPLTGTVFLAINARR